MVDSIPLLGMSIVGRAPFGYFPPIAVAPPPGTGMDGVDPARHPVANLARVVRRDNGLAGPLFVVAGQAHDSAWDLTLIGDDPRSPGLASGPTPYPATAVLTARVEGTVAATGRPATRFVPHVEWVDASAGRALLVVRPSQFAGTPPGGYLLTVDVVSGGVSSVALRVGFSVIPHPYIPAESP